MTDLILTTMTPNTDKKLNNIHHAINPFICVLRVVGLAPVELVNKTQDLSDLEWATRRSRLSEDNRSFASEQQVGQFKYQVSTAGKIYAISLVLAVAVATPIHVIRLYKYLSTLQSGLTSLMYAFYQIFTNIVAIILITLFTCGLWNKIGMFLDVFNQLDNIFMNPKDNVHSATRIFLLWEVSIIFLMVIVYIFINVMFSRYNWVDSLTFIASRHFGRWVILIFNVLIGNLALLTKHRFCQLNKKLSEVLDTGRRTEKILNTQPVTQTKDMKLSSVPENELVSVTHPSTSNLRCPCYTQLLNHLRESHSILCDAIHDVNETFGLLLLVSLFSHFMELIFHMYVFVALYFNNMMTVGLSLNILYETLVEIISALFLTLSCDCASSEATDSGLILQKMTFLKDVDQSTMKEIYLFLKQITNSKFHFTAGRFFTLDRAMLFSTLGVIMTYMVVLVQFRIN